MVDAEDRNFPEAFYKIEEFIPGIGVADEQPEVYVRYVHKRWKELGGVLAGKPRHSDRYLNEQLKAKAMAIPSLTPKLIGKTRIKPDECAKLTRFFLLHWPQPGPEDAEEGDGDILYTPIFSEDEIDEIADYIESCFENPPPQPQPSKKNDAPGPRTVDGGGIPLLSNLPGESTTTLLGNRFEECDALFTVATATAFVTTGRATQLVGFRDLMNSWKAVEDDDGIARPLVWVLDYGVRKFDSEEARLRFIACQTLITRFKALKGFDERGGKSRWEWLSSRAAFVVLDTLYDEHVELRGVKRPSFLPHHVSFSELSPTWAKSPNFRTLYGSDLEKINERAFTVFFRANGWNKEADRWTLGAGTPLSADIPLVHRRYFGHGSFALDNKPGSDRFARSLELPVPEAGGRYGDAYRAVYAATTEFLGLENRLRETPIVESRQAVAQLRLLGFRILNLNEFMTL